MKNIAVILAGGVGARTGLSIPKQFLKVAGKTIIEHTISTFNTHSLIDEIWLVVNAVYIPLMEEICLRNNWKKVCKILNGGVERSDSSLAAINACEYSECNLIFHDSVRPLVSKRIISDVIEQLNVYDAVDVAISVADTIIECKDHFISNIPNREILQRGQTPQGFRLSVIKKAYELAQDDSSFKVTDDCGVVKRYLPELPIFVIKGEEKNMKVTRKEDLFIIDKFFQLQSESAGSNCNEQSLKGKVAVIFGGSYGIGKCIFDRLRELDCDVYSFSRSEGGVDISDCGAVEKSMKDVYLKTNRIDYVINTAAVLKKIPLINMEDQDILNILNVNLLGAINIAKLSHQYLKDTKGSLLLFTSSSYTRGRAFYSLYSATKAAIVNFTQAVSQEWIDAEIRINCINPERTKTPMRKRNFGNEADNSLIRPEKVAIASINALLAENSGQVYDVKIDN